MRRNTFHNMKCYYFILVLFVFIFCQFDVFPSSYEIGIGTGYREDCIKTKLWDEMNPNALIFKKKYSNLRSPNIEIFAKKQKKNFLFQAKASYGWILDGKMNSAFFLDFDELLVPATFDRKIKKGDFLVNTDTLLK